MTKIVYLKRKKDNRIATVNIQQQTVQRKNLIVPVKLKFSNCGVMKVKIDEDKGGC